MIAAARLDGVEVYGSLTDPYLNPEMQFFGSDPGPSVPIVNLTCPSDFKAKYIQVMVHQEVLSLCEVDVFGQGTEI